MMTQLATSLLCLGSLVTLSGISSAQAPATLRERRVDSLFAEFTRGTSPGVAVAVVRDGKVLLSKGYGLASLEHRVPITPTTAFDVASVSKQFAGLAVSMLVEQGKVKLTDDIRTYIPELANVGHTITIENLLHHTSGLRDWPGTLALAGWRMDDVISFEQILTMAFNQRSLNFVPGAEYTYSNTGYNLLAEVVKRVTGQSFREWTDAHLFRPLGMVNTHFRDDHTVVIPNRAFGYARTADGRYASVTNNLTALGSSSLVSTVDDLAKWVMNFDDPKVGGGAAMARTRTRGVLNDGSTIPYAFGISHGEYRGLATVSHSGSWASFATYLVHFPQQRFGVIVLANSGNSNPTRSAHNIADLFLESELGPRAAPATPASATEVTIAPSLLERYAGIYRLGPGWYIRIRRDGLALRAQASREAEVAMIAQSDTTFWVESYSAPIAFARAGAGEGVQLVYRGRRTPKLVEPPPKAITQLAEFAGVYESGELQASYIVEVRDGALVMRHRRHGIITLTHLWEDDFGSSAWFARSVEFTRDAAGGVVGFAVFVDERSRDIRFDRRR